MPYLQEDFNSQVGSNTVMLYFHGNAEDIGVSYDFLDDFRY